MKKAYENSCMTISYFNIENVMTESGINNDSLKMGEAYLKKKNYTADKADWKNIIGE